MRLVSRVSLGEPGLVSCRYRVADIIDVPQGAIAA